MFRPDYATLPELSQSIKCRKIEAIKAKHANYA